MTPFRRTMHPAWYHGEKARPPFFEGWYYKLVDRTGQHKLAVIPGIFKGKQGTSSHAFIQVLDGTHISSYYQTFPTPQFVAAHNAFSVDIGPNHFDAQGLDLHIDNAEIRLSGSIKLGPLNPWPVTLLSPGIMGWYAWIPFMECFHGVLSLDHALSGSLMYNGTRIDFTNGRGYLEKDWGRAFPEGYLWLQSNHFGRTGISITASIAIIPWIRQPFPGFIVGLLCDGELYRFATYNGARIRRLEIDDDAITWTITRKQLKLEMHAVRAEGGLLKAPTLEGMDRRIVESMNATVNVRLSEGQTTLFEGQGQHCGLEAAGDLRRLLALQRRKTAGNTQE